jgi:hypothetical protein
LARRTTSELLSPTASDEKIVSDALASLRALGTTARRSVGGADFEAGVPSACGRMEIAHAGLSAGRAILAPRDTNFSNTASCSPRRATAELQSLTTSRRGGEIARPEKGGRFP